MSFAPVNPARSQSHPWLYPALIVGAVLCAFANSFAGCFLLDDADHIVQSLKVRSLPPGEIFRARGLATTTLALNYAVGGLDVRGYHAVNLAIHLAAALTLYGLVRRTLLRGPDGSPVRESAAGLALAVALLWAVHPLQTQAVTYVVRAAWRASWGSSIY